MNWLIQEIINDPLQAIASALSLLGVYLVSEHINLIGWSINGFADILWIWWGYKTHAVFLIFLQIAFLLIAINGFRNA